MAQGAHVYGYIFPVAYELSGKKITHRDSEQRFRNLGTQNPKVYFGDYNNEQMMQIR